MFEQTGCDGVMVARGAQGNPWLFKEINELIKTGEVKTAPQPQERLRVALEHISRLIEDKGESRGIKEARKHLAWYIKGLKGATQIRTEIFKISDFATMSRILTNYIDTFR